MYESDIRDHLCRLIVSLLNLYWIVVWSINYEYHRNNHNTKALRNN